MKLEEAIKIIIKQNGDCSGVGCIGILYDYERGDDCPCLEFCSKNKNFAIECLKKEKYNICLKLNKPKTTQEEFEI